MSTLRETAQLFLRLGTTAFGGPAAHIAMMEEEVVRRRGWLSREQFLDYLGVTNLIPGPNSTELAMLIGLARHGWPGLVIAGVCFILPASIIVSLFAWAYVRYGSLPRVEGILYGVIPVVLAIVVRALWQLARASVKSAMLAALLVLSVVAIAAGVHELVVLIGAGVVSGTVSAGTRRLTTGVVVALGLEPAGIAMSAAVAAQGTFSLWTLFAVFLKIGAILFGSGYVLLAFLRADFVDRLGWLTERQILDAVAVGQVTPGPLFTTATFIGYVLGGVPGAAAATVGIFLPGFLFVAFSGPLVPRIRRSRFAGAALDGVTVASLALMAIVTFQLGESALVAPLPIGIFIASLALLWSPINTTWLVAGGALVGWLSSGG